MLGWLSVIRVQADPPPGYYLVWSDEFNGTSLDPTKWWVWDQPDRSGFTVPEAATVGGGYLTLHTYTTNGANYSAIISSDARFRPWYGYLESSVEFNGSPGMFSDFWVQSPDNGVFLNDPADSGAELDICEHRVTTTNNVGDISGMVTIDLHWNGYTSGIEKTAGSGLVGSGLGTGFHTYGLLWNSTNYTVSIDGAPAWNTNVGIAQRTEIIMLSSEVDSNSFCGIVPSNGYGNFQASTTSTVVDYVRYYAPTTTVFWVGASSANWTDGGNWLSNMVPTSASDVVFDYLSTGNTSITLTQNITVNTLAIQESGPVTISGSPLTVNGGGVDMVSAIYNAVVASPLVLGANQNWKIGSGYWLTVAGPVSGSGNLTLTGMGIVALVGTNTSSGLTTVSNGQFLVDGVVANAVTVIGGALGGTGIIGGPVQVNAGSTLSPGNGIGVLAISNTLALAPGSITAVDINKSAGGNDEVIGLTSVTYGGTLSINNQGAAFAAGDAFKLFDARGYSGAFGRIIPITPGVGLAWDTGTLAIDGTLRVTGTNSPNITASLAGSQLAVSWPANNIGWNLQIQTNGPGVGLTTNWVTVTGSWVTNLMMSQINPAMGSVFFRLVAPTFTDVTFARNDLIVLQVGNGSINAAGAPGVLNDYLTVGGPLQTQVALPTSGASSLIFGGSSYDGALSVSADGQKIVVGGYAIPLGSFSGTIDTSSSTGATAVPRGVGLMDAAGNFTLAATTTKFSGGTIRSAAADGAGNCWAGGGLSGIVYLGTNSSPSTLSSVSSATRNLGFVNGNLCFTETGSGDGVMAFSGAPRSAATPVLLVNTGSTGTGTPSPKGFAFNPALTIAYVADNRASSSGGGIQRFNWNGSSWVYAYTIGYTLSSSKEVYDFVADFSGANPVIYAITGEAAANKLVTVTDTGASSAFKVLETAPSGDAFRGLVFAP